MRNRRLIQLIIRPTQIYTVVETGGLDLNDIAAIECVYKGGAADFAEGHGCPGVD